MILMTINSHTENKEQFILKNCKKHLSTTASFHNKSKT